jgi:hypothetical protein
MATQEVSTHPFPAQPRGSKNQSLDSKAKDIVRCADDVISEIRSALHYTRKRPDSAQLLAIKPYGDIYGVFALSAHLAGEAIELAKAAQQKEPDRFKPALDFWYAFRDYALVASLNCAGGNQSLAEGQVTLQLLRNAGGGE